MEWPADADTNEKRAAACLRAAEELRLLHNATADPNMKAGLLRKQRIVLCLANQYAEAAGLRKPNPTDKDNAAWAEFKVESGTNGLRIDINTINPVADVQLTKNLPPAAAAAGLER